jgi:general secretion pathway protein A
LYQEFFHFSEAPFSIAPDPHFVFMSHRHQEGLAHLLYGINYGGGFVALTGEVGTGKTTLCHCLLQQLPDNINIALILNPKLDAIELLAAICDELHIRYNTTSISLKNLIDALNQHLLKQHSLGRKTVLLIDEAQNLSLDVMEQIRLLTNLETTKTKLLQIILVGQPELKDKLQRKDLRQLNQRITARYHLLPLSFTETQAYLKHRLSISKGDPDLFEETAIKSIHKYSAGVPRLINIICHNALLGAYAADKRRITANMIDQAAQESLSIGKSESGKPRLVILLTLLLTTLGLAYYFYWPVFGYSLSKTVDSANNFAPTSKVAAKTLSPAHVTAAPKPPVKSFAEWLNNPALTLPANVNKTMQLWHVKAPEVANMNDQALQEYGMQWFFDKGHWKDILAYNRPTIMEFNLSAHVKRYALLKSIDNGNPVFVFDEPISFPLSDVLKFWDGYFLLLWQLPKPAMPVIYPGQTSDHVTWLRQQMQKIDGLNPATDQPNLFDNALKVRVISFQNSQNLSPDGKVGLQTLFRIDNATGAEGSPHLTDE